MMNGTEIAIACLVLYLIMCWAYRLICNAVQADHAMQVSMDEAEIQRRSEARRDGREV